jgi:TRAP-type C4-dicarboxylate transport system permease small subunit
MKPMKLIYKLFKAGALISLLAMIAAVTIQVFARFFLESAPHWTEEAARIFFVYPVGFGTAIGIKNGDFIRLDLITKYLTGKLNKWLNIFTDVTVIVFAIILTVYSVRFVQLGMDELSPALQITMGFVFISITLIGLSVILFTIANLYYSLKGK